jgi:tripartite tricarboxylate transporter TctB family protein
MEAPGPGPKEAVGADLVIPLLALAFATYFFWSIADLAWEAKANGVLIGTVLVSLIGVLLARLGLQVATARADFGFDRVLAPRDALGKRIGLVALTVAFIAAMQWLGLTLALFLAMAAALFLMGLRRPARIFWTSFAVAACAYLLFVALLETDIPHGPVENLISLLVSRRA